MSAERSILHLSDIHFGPKHLARVSEGIARRVEEERPSLVVISGDLTQRAKPAQFRQAREFVAQLQNASPVIAVPGNHDVPLWRVWERLVAPFRAYRRHFRAELETVFEDEALFVAGINTAQAFALKGGRIRGRRIREIERLVEAVPADRFRIAVVHHHLEIPQGVDCEHPAWGAKYATERLGRAGIDLVLSGHLHRTLELFPAGRDRFPALHTGTSSSSRGRGPEAGRNTAHAIEIGADRFLVRGLLWSPSDGSFETVFEKSYPRTVGRSQER